MSMSGGWFFVVASEAITVGDTTITLPGVGSYIAKANDAGDWSAIGAAVLTMAIVILLYDQLLFRPIVAWAAKFRVELSVSQDVETLLGAEPHQAHPLAASGRRSGLRRAERASACGRLRFPRICRRESASEAAIAARRRHLDPRHHRRRRLGGVAHDLLYRDRIELGRGGACLRSDVLYAHSRRRADAACDSGLGADQRLDRPQASLGGGHSADRPVSRGLSGQPSVRRGGEPCARLQSQPEHLAEFSHRLRHAMVYRIQHDRRRGGLSQRLARSGREFWRSRMAVVDPGDHSGRCALLFDGRNHRVWRVLERFDRRRIRQVERPHRRRPGRRIVHRGGHGQGRLPENCARRRVMSIFVTLFNRLFWRRLYAYAERRLRL